MNQYIRIRYRPELSSDPNYWDIWFALNNKDLREKSPSALNSNGNWDWYIQGKYQKHGNNFDWNSK